MAATLRRIVAAAVAGLIWLSCAPAPAAAQARSAADQNLIATLLYQSKSSEAALLRRTDARLLALRREIGAKDSALAALRRQLRAEQARSAAARSAAAREAEKLEAEAAALKLRFAQDLAARDEEFSRERALLLSVGEDLLKSDEGRRALALYNAGGEGAWEAADAVLAKVQEGRRRAREDAARRESAADYRARGELAVDALYHGRTTVPRVLAIYLELVRTDPGDSAAWAAVATLHRQGRNLPSARDAALRAIETARDVDSKAAALIQMGALLWDLRDYKGSRAALAQAGRLIHGSASKVEGGIAVRGSSALLLAQINVGIGQTYLSEADHEAAGKWFRRALADAERLVEANPDIPLLKQRVSEAARSVADVEMALGDHAAARSLLERSLETTRTLLAADSSSETLKESIFLTTLKLGDTYLGQGRWADAARNYTEALASARELARSDPDSPAKRRDVGMSLDRLAGARTRLGDHEAALAAHREAADLMRSVLPSTVADSAAKADLALSLHKAAESAVELKRFALAATFLGEAAPLLERLVAQEKLRDDMRLLAQLADVYALQGAAASGSGDRAAAEALERKALGIRAGLAERRPLVPRFQLPVLASLHALAGLPGGDDSWRERVRKQLDLVRGLQGLDARDRSFIAEVEAALAPGPARTGQRSE